MDALSKCYEEHYDSYKAFSEVDVLDENGKKIISDEVLQSDGDTNEQLNEVTSPGLISLCLDSVKKAVNELMEKQERLETLKKNRLAGKKFPLRQPPRNNSKVTTHKQVRRVSPQQKKNSCNFQQD